MTNPTTESTQYDAVIVTGDRYALWPDWRDVVEHAVNQYVESAASVLHGAARGIDTLVADYFRRTRPYVSIQGFPADWNAHGRAAGPIRNQEMLDVLLDLSQTGARIAVLAFHNDLAGSKGTKHMVGIARKAGVPVHVFTRKGEVKP